MNFIVMMMLGLGLGLIGAYYFRMDEESRDIDVNRDVCELVRQNVEKTESGKEIWEDEEFYILVKKINDYVNGRYTGRGARDLDGFYKPMDFLKNKYHDQRYAELVKKLFCKRDCNKRVKKRKKRHYSSSSSKEGDESDYSEVHDRKKRHSKDEHEKKEKPDKKEVKEKKETHVTDKKSHESTKTNTSGVHNNTEIHNNTTRPINSNNTTKPVVTPHPIQMVQNIKQQIRTRPTKPFKDETSDQYHKWATKYLREDGEESHQHRHVTNSDGEPCSNLIIKSPYADESEISQFIDQFEKKIAQKIKID
ncbi:hypothetical protein ECANGB1_2627 [Enterospora canceri]|uniref:Uncharacterized protein n=1 Tax=Enterospora canceri TaxID=1081671 RepID=A0A1Y1S9E4_9MICR|nr:hypothetical protein ECANGB1_2627 [Enterospora canceri]